MAYDHDAKRLESFLIPGLLLTISMKGLSIGLHEVPLTPPHALELLIGIVDTGGPLLVGDVTCIVIEELPGFLYHMECEGCQIPGNVDCQTQICVPQGTARVLALDTAALRGLETRK